MREVGILEAKTKFSALVSDVEANGDAILIKRHGKVVAQLSPPPRLRLGPDEWRDLIQRRIAEADAMAPQGEKPFDLRKAMGRD